MSQMEMPSNMNMVSSTNTTIQSHQMMQQPMQSPLMSHSTMGPLQNKSIVQQMNRQQPQPNQIGQPPVMMPHQQSQQMQLNQMQQRPTQQPQPQQLQQPQQQSQPQMGYQNYYANFGNR